MLPVIYIEVNIVIQISFQALNKVSCSEEVLAGDREGSQVAGEGRRGRGWTGEKQCWWGAENEKWGRRDGLG